MQMKQAYVCQMQGRESGIRYCKSSTMSKKMCDAVICNMTCQSPLTQYRQEVIVSAIDIGCCNELKVGRRANEHVRP